MIIILAELEKWTVFEYKTTALSNRYGRGGELALQSDFPSPRKLQAGKGIINLPRDGKSRGKLIFWQSTKNALTC